MKRSKGRCSRSARREVAGEVEQKRQKVMFGEEETAGGGARGDVEREVQKWGRWQQLHGATEHL